MRNSVANRATETIPGTLEFFYGPRFEHSREMDLLSGLGAYVNDFWQPHFGDRHFD